MSFIYGGNTGLTPEQAASRRKIAEALAFRAATSAPQNVGEGLSALGQSIAGALMLRNVNKVEKAGREGVVADFNSAIPSLFSQAAPSASTNSTAASGGAPADIAKQIIAMGYSPQAASGIVGNFMHESALNPTAVGDGGTSFGLGQWHNERKTGLDQYAQEIGGNPVDIPMQLAYMQKELKGPESNVAAALQRAQTPEDAATAFMGFERPKGYTPDNPQGGMGYQSRVSNAQAVAAQLGGQSQADGSGRAQKIQKLVGLATNPWTPEPILRIVNFILQQEMDAMSPKAPIKLGEGDTLLDPQTFQPVYQAPPKADPYTLSPGEIRYGPDGKQIAAAPPKPTDPPDKVQQYQFYSQQEQVAGRQPKSFDEWDLSHAKAGATSITQMVGGEGADAKLLGSLEGKEGERWSDIKQAGLVASGLSQDFEVLDSLMTAAPQSPIVGRLAEMFPGFSTTGAAFESVVKRVAPSLRVAGSGSTSDIEYEGMLKGLPRLQYGPEANRIIAETMKSKAQINIARSSIITQAENHEITVSDARRQLDEINKKSIVTPQLRALLNQAGATAPKDMSDDELSKLLGAPP